MLKQQINLVLLAIMFFTRLPVGSRVDYSAEKLHQANRYFSLVGMLVAALLALSFSFFHSYLSPTISVILTIAVSLLLTGAFHEDGLADMADGIGGGQNTNQRLAIMKDSRIGTYGTVTLIVSLILKIILMIELAQVELLIAALFLAHALSRAIAASFIFDMDYVADIDSSKAKPMAAKQSRAELLIGLSIGIAPLALFHSQLLLPLFVTLVIFRLMFKRWLNKRLGGYTGDCLGAAQQITELLIYLVILAVCVSADGVEL